MADTVRLISTRGCTHLHLWNGDVVKPHAKTGVFEVPAAAAEMLRSHGFITEAELEAILAAKKAEAEAAKAAASPA